MPGDSVCIPSAGSASATSTAVAAPAETTGCARTRSSTKPQTRDCPPARWRRRPTNGTRPFSVQPFSPSHESIAGRNVSEPIIATATTVMVPTPKETNTDEPDSSIPAIEVSTMKPDTTTA
jgi:hypothetical protein